MAKKKRKKTVIFDWDGVIADTLPNYLVIVTELARCFGNKRKITAEILRDNWCGGWQSLYEHTLGIPAKKTKEAMNLYYSLKQRETRSPLFGGIKEALKEIAKDYRLSIVTASDTADVLEMLMFYNTHFFEGVYGQDMSPNVRKGNPCYFLEPLQRWGINPADAVSIGDTVDEIKMGKGVGLKATIACSWGWQSEELLKKAGPSLIIDSPSKIPAAVRILMED